MYWRRHVRDIVLAAAFVAAASTVVAAATPDASAKTGEVAPPKTAARGCSGAGGPIDSCNACVVGPPSEPCVWELQKKK